MTPQEEMMGGKSSLEKISQLTSQGIFYAFAIHDDNGKMVIGIEPSGKVVIGDGFTADKAARKFWEWMETITLDGEKVMNR